MVLLLLHEQLYVSFLLGMHPVYSIVCSLCRSHNLFLLLLFRTVLGSFLVCIQGNKTFPGYCHIFFEHIPYRGEIHRNSILIPPGNPPCIHCIPLFLLCWSFLKVGQKFYFCRGMSLVKSSIVRESENQRRAVSKKPFF